MKPDNSLAKLSSYLQQNQEGEGLDVLAHVWDERPGHACRAAYRQEAATDGGGAFGRRWRRLTAAGERQESAGGRQDVPAVPQTPTHSMI
jgi:hypothetical protein